jgi:methionyl-tRNA formyltransferase
MKIIFAGTPEFAAAALRSIHAAGHEVALVLTQPDRRAGRGLKPAPSAVKQLARQLELAIAQPQTLKAPEVVQEIAAVGADAMVVAAYGLILPPAILELPRRGCLNIHASLLPRWRGAAPIQRALLAGDRETGVSIMQMDAGLDTGPVLMEQSVPIAADDTAQTLHDRLAALGAELIVRALAGQPEPRPQDDAGATYASKIDKREARIDWSRPADMIERQVRAFNPVPGASTAYGAIELKIWRASVVDGIAAEPGRVCAADTSGITVAAGTRAIRISELQRAGGKRVSAAAFLSGCALVPGDRLHVNG